MFGANSGGTISNPSGGSGFQGGNTAGYIKASGTFTPDYLIPNQREKSTVRTNPTVLRQLPNPNQTSWVANTTSTPPKIIFELPQDNVYDLRGAYLLLTVAATQTGGTFVRINNQITSIFDQVRIMNGAVEQDRIDKYQLITRILQISTSDQERTDNQQKMLMGVDSTANRNSNSSGKKYAMPLFLALFKDKAICPYILNAKLWIEFTMADPRTYIEQDGTAPVVTVTSPVLMIQNVGLDQAQLRAYAAQLRSIIPYYSYHAFEYNAFNWLTSVSSIDCQIRTKASSLTALIVVIRKQADITDSTVNDKLDTYNFNSMSSYQLKIDGTPYPPEAIQCASGIEPYVRFLNYMNGWSSFGGSRNAFTNINTNYATNKFILIHGFENHEHLSGQDMTGLNTSNGTKNIILTLTATAAPANQMLVEIFSVFDQANRIVNGVMERLN